MASNNASRQIFVEKRIVKELTIKFWFNSIQNTQAETLKAALKTHARIHREFSQETPPDKTRAGLPMSEIPLPPIHRKIRESSRYQRVLASGCGSSISGSTGAYQAPSYFQRDLSQQHLVVPGIFLHHVKYCHHLMKRHEINVLFLSHNNEYLPK
jgi:hypothetical protein